LGPHSFDGTENGAQDATGRGKILNVDKFIVPHVNNPEQKRKGKEKERPIDLSCKGRYFPSMKYIQHVSENYFAWIIKFSVCSLPSVVPAAIPIGRWTFFLIVASNFVTQSFNAAHSRYPSL
jgi:hypothetical protein